MLLRSIVPTIVWATLAIAAPSAQSLIDFESVPGGVPAEGLSISTQYLASHGVTFALADGTAPVLARVGAPLTAFEGYQLQADQPAPTASVGEFFLTDDGVLNGLPQPLIVTYASPVASTSGVILDIDAAEQWTVEAFDQNGVSLGSRVLGPNNSLDGSATQWALTVPSMLIKSIEIRFTGTTANGLVGLAFDNFTPASAPTSLEPGDLLVADFISFGGTGQIIKVDPDTGSQSVAFSGGLLVDPIGIAFASNGDVLIADGNQPGPGIVIRIDPSTGQQTVVSQGGNLVYPVAILEETGGDLVVVDRDASGGTGAVIRIDANAGTQSVVSVGQHFVVPNDIACDLGGYVVSDTGVMGPDPVEGLVLRVDPASGAQTVLASGNGLIAPAGIKLFQGDVYVTDHRNDPGIVRPGSVVRIDPSGAQTVVASGGWLDDPLGIAVGDGQLWITDTATARVVRVDPVTGVQALVSAGGLLVSPRRLAIVPGLDADGDGLPDSVETDTGVFLDRSDTGTNPNNPDTDGDGLLDGTEVELAVNGCPDPLNPDSDGDLISDGDEVASGTDPCSPDTDADGLCDLVDPDPLVPGTSSGALEDGARILADQVDAFDLSLFSGPNANANAGRRNSMSNRIRNAANSIARGNNSSAVALLTTVLAHVDGQGNDEWMHPSSQRDALAACLVSLIGPLL